MSHEDKGADALKPCPFCGGDGAIYGDSSHGFYAACLSCDCTIGYESHPAHGSSFSNGDNASEVWNKRDEMAWMPIESAPTDGSRVIVLCYNTTRNHGEPHVCSAQHVAHRHTGDMIWLSDAGFVVDAVYWVPCPIWSSDMLSGA